MESVQLTVKAKRRILKFAEGADPSVDEPIEVQEEEITLTGEQAKQMIEQQGISMEQAKQIAEGGNQ